MQRVTVHLEGAVHGAFEVSAAEPLLFGRVPGARVRLEDRRCSRLHCRIELGAEGLEIVDLGSRNGTWLNEVPIQRAALPDRCTLRLGDSVIEVRVAEVKRRLGVCSGLSAALDANDTYIGPPLGAQEHDEAANALGSELRGDVEPPLDLTQLERLGFRDVQTLEADGTPTHLVAIRSPLEQRVALEFVVLGTERERDERLARIFSAARLSHPAIARALDVIECAEHALVVREHVPGGSLRSELARTGGRLDVGRFFAVALPLAQALAHAHAHGVYHHALNPEAIWLGASGEVKVFGFGTGAPASSAAAFLAPEQREPGRYPDARADLYGFGALAVFALTGKTPPISHTGAPLPQALNALLDGVPEDVKGVIARALAPTPGERFESAVRLVEALEEAVRRYYGLFLGEAALLARLGASVGPRPGGPDLETTRHVRSFRSNEDMTRFGGRFAGCELADLLQMLELNDKSGRVEVIDAAGAQATLVLRYGRVLEARYGALRGPDAVRAVLALDEGQFGVVLAPVDAPGARGFALGPLLLECAMDDVKETRPQPKSA